MSSWLAVTRTTIARIGCTPSSLDWSCYSVIKRCSRARKSRNAVWVASFEIGYWEPGIHANFYWHSSTVNSFWHGVVVQRRAFVKKTNKAYVKKLISCRSWSNQQGKFKYQPWHLVDHSTIDEDYGGYCETYLGLICKMEHIFACHV